mgnify:CR=1 FL=1|tara:strand:+ start:4244 stop:5164 length:921 start_codon:yes stop_codon:yes gene_type:complete
MAWKFRQELVRDGDVVEPSEFRINVNEFTSEINGFLDSDNIEEDVIDQDKIKRGTFTRVLGMSNLMGHSYLFNHDQAGWYNETYSRRDDQLSFDEGGVSAFRSEPISGYSGWPSGAEPYGTDKLNSKKRLPHCQFDTNEDGLIICEFSGFVQWLRSHSHTDYKQNGRTSGGVATTPFWANQYSYFSKQNKWFKLSSSYVLCSMWRITVNGQSVAETGPIGNEYDAHPVYLCGSTPILKGKDNVAQLEARFIWYSLGRDHSIDASGWAPVDVTGSPGGTTLTDGDTYTWRRDCTLNSPSMHVIYRKR